MHIARGQRTRCLHLTVDLFINFVYIVFACKDIVAFVSEKRGFSHHELNSVMYGIKLNIINIILASEYSYICSITKAYVTTMAGYIHTFS